MENKELVKQYINHESNRFISAALLAFSKSIDKALQKGQKLNGRAFQVFLKKHSTPQINQAIYNRLHSSKSKFCQYHCFMGKFAIRIVCEMTGEPIDLFGLAKENENQIEDALEQEKFNNPTKLEDLPTEVIQLTKEDLNDDTLH